MHYKSSSSLAFDSVNFIVREINGGWIVRFVHIVGASAFFCFLIVHVSRGLYYSSFKLVNTWLIGVTILLVSMGTAFLGYVLP